MDHVNFFGVLIIVLDMKHFCVLGLLDFLCEVCLPSLSAFVSAGPQRPPLRQIVLLSRRPSYKTGFLATAPQRPPLCQIVLLSAG
jgi:hypothetical protein